MSTSEELQLRNQFSPLSDQSPVVCTPTGTSTTNPELRCGIRVSAQLALCVPARCRKNNGQTTALSKNGTVARTTGMSKLSPELTVWTITPGLYNNGTSTSCRLKKQCTDFQRPQDPSSPSRGSHGGRQSVGPILDPSVAANHQLSW